MGTIVLIKCLDCTYSTELGEGTGMLGIEMTPMECRRCEELVTVPISLDAAARAGLGGEIDFGCCRICGGDDLLPISELWDEQGRLLECPKCRGRATVENGGIWD